MKAMVLQPGPYYSVKDVANGWVSGLRAAGVDVRDVNYDERMVFYAAALDALPGGDPSLPSVSDWSSASICGDFYRFWPDLIVIICGFFVPEWVYRLTRAHGHKVVLVCTESPYEDDKQLGLADRADVVIVNDPTNLDAFRAINPQSHYFPHCYDPAVHYPGPPQDERTQDFVFVGSGFPSRIEFLEKIDWWGIDARLEGHWEAVTDDSPIRSFCRDDPTVCTPNHATADLYRAARMSMNLYRKEANETAHAYGWAMGPREVELAATRTFFVREPRSEGDQLFPFLPTITDPAEAGDLLRHYLARPDLRQDLADRACEAVADRSFVHNARRLLALVN